MQAMPDAIPRDDGIVPPQDPPRVSKPSLKCPPGRLRTGAAGAGPTPAPVRDTHFWEALDRFEQVDPGGDA